MGRRGLGKVEGGRGLMEGNEGGGRGGGEGEGSLYVVFDATRRK